ncbi:hypothetical protein ACLB2K_056547 [Fragaria x ananassa]
MGACTMCCELLLAVFLPPLGVVIRYGCGLVLAKQRCSRHLSSVFRSFWCFGSLDLKGRSQGQQNFHQIVKEDADTKSKKWLFGSASKEISSDT